MKITLRAAVAEDADALADLHLASWRATYRGVLTDAWLDGPAQADRRAMWGARLASPAPGMAVWRLDVDDAMAGLACAFLDGHAAHGTLLENLHVAATHRGLGLGARLVREVAAWSVASAPGRPMHLSVVATNHAARGFYHRLGARLVDAETWDTPDGRQVACEVLRWDDPRALVSVAR